MEREVEMSDALMSDAVFWRLQVQRRDSHRRERDQQRQLVQEQHGGQARGQPSSAAQEDRREQRRPRPGQPRHAHHSESRRTHTLTLHNARVKCGTASLGVPMLVFLPLHQFELPAEEYADCLPDGELLALPLLLEEKSDDPSRPGGPAPSPSLDFNDNEDLPTELSDSSETHDEGDWLISS